jgi:hypothetical protein
MILLDPSTHNKRRMIMGNIKKDVKTFSSFKKNGKSSMMNSLGHRTSIISMESEVIKGKFN